MLPTVLKYFLDVPQTTDIARHMMSATVYGFKLYQFGPDSTPVMLPSSDPQHRVEGMLILGLNEEQRNKVYEYESGLMRLVDVQAYISQLDSFEGYEIRSVRIVDAGAFVWNQEKADEAMNELPTTDPGMYTWPIDGLVCSQLYRNMCAAQRASTMDLARTSASGV